MNIHSRETSAREIFAQILGKPPEERSRLLESLCGGNNQLRLQVEDMLAVADRNRTSPVDLIADELQEREPSLNASISPIIGNYKLREKLGEGGMGEVYVAEQTEPVRRKVALKVMKPGMDSRQVIARFEAERQSLALMSHPNISRVFDGGTTPEGCPFLVMELVKGLPITESCDHQQLGVRERLKLFLTVCDAV